MRFAPEIIELLASYPGREFRTIQIVRYVANGKNLDLRERRATRKAVLRALEAFVETGSVLVRPPQRTRGGPAWYAWKSET